MSTGPLFKKSFEPVSIRTSNYHTADRADFEPSDEAQDSKKMQSPRVSSPNVNRTKAVNVTTWTPQKVPDIERLDYVEFENEKFTILQTQPGTNLKIALDGKANSGTAFFFRQIDKKGLQWSKIENKEDILKSLKRLPPHPSILPLYGHFSHQSQDFLVYKFNASMISLPHFIQTKGIPNIPTLARWVLEIAFGLSHLHSQGIQHNNLVPETILIDTRDQKIKLTEYGFPTSLFQEMGHERNDSLDLLALIQCFFQCINLKEKTQLPSYIANYLSTPLQTLLVGPQDQEFISTFDRFYNWVLENDVQKPATIDFSLAYANRALKKENGVPSPRSQTGSPRGQGSVLSLSSIDSTTDISAVSYQLSADNILGNYKQPTTKPIQDIIPRITDLFTSYEYFSWSQFCNAINKYSDTPTQTLNRLRCFFVKNGDQVYKSHWEKISQWFKPLYPCGTQRKQVAEQGYTLSEIADLLSPRWFHGFMETQQSVDLLWGKPAGSFLFRFSSVARHYSLSVSSGTQVGHWRIQAVPTPSGVDFLLDDRCYASLQEIVSSHKNLPLQLLNSPDPSKGVCLLHPIDRTDE